ncbi:hypothetical protein Syun_011649 [Stephania yunnanensis]|uniref:CCHC-type domain-containing protein n=1 Tax=Stephania yunnanensis TaxID=152371 RepID=A0AAP0JYP0_9MAGN
MKSDGDLVGCEGDATGLGGADDGVLVGRGVVVVDDGDASEATMNTAMEDSETVSIGEATQGMERSMLRERETRAQAEKRERDVIRGLMAEVVAKDRDRVRVPVKCRNRDRDKGLVKHRDRDSMFHTDRDFNVLVWECGQPGHFTNTCSQQRAGTTEPGADSYCCRARWCVLCLEVLEEPNSSWRKAQLIAEEPSPTE